MSAHLPYRVVATFSAFTSWPLPRETPADGTNILRHYIPGGVTVAMSAFVAHMQESMFPQAARFVTERFSGEAGKALQPYYLAFSACARGCTGRNISYLEQTVVLGSVLRRYGSALSTPEWQLERLETMNWKCLSKYDGGIEIGAEWLTEYSMAYHITHCAHDRQFRTLDVMHDMYPFENDENLMGLWCMA